MSSLKPLWTVLGAGMLSLALVGCNGEEPVNGDDDNGTENGDGDDDDDDDDDVGPFEPDTISVGGEFAYDANADQIVHFDDDDESVPPTMFIEVADEGAYSAGGTICSFLVTADDQTPVEWEHDGENPVTQLGFLADPPASVEMHAAPDNLGDCDDWADGIWGDDPEAWVGSLAWGLGVGPFHSDMQSDLQDIDQDEGTDYATTLSGGGWHMELLVNPEDANSTGYRAAWNYGGGLEAELDNGTVVLVQDGDDYVELTQAQVDDIDNWETGVYWTSSLYIIGGLFGPAE